MLFERLAYHSPRRVCFDIFKTRFNQALALEVKQHLYRFKNEKNLPIFDKVIAYQEILCEKVQEGEYRFKILL